MLMRVAVETLYVQLLFTRRVDGADALGWVSVAMADDRRVACRRASRAYSTVKHPVGGTPDGVRVVSDWQILRESGERGLRRAGAGILAVAMALEGASAGESRRQPAAELSLRRTS
jgi:hypothetical protein